MIKIAIITDELAIAKGDGFAWRGSITRGILENLVIEMTVKRSSGRSLLGTIAKDRFLAIVEG